MIEFIIQMIIGLGLIIIGIFNTKGNISLLHSYHRKRVKKEDELPFGKKIGLGIIIIGCSMIISVILLFINEIYLLISNIILAGGYIIGLIIIFYALFKYNKGIF